MQIRRKIGKWVLRNWKRKENIKLPWRNKDLDLLDLFES